MAKVLRVFEKSSYVAGYVSGWVVILIILLTMVEVVTRYVFRQPLILCDEFGGYSLFTISFLGLSYCANENGHIRVTFIVERMPSKVGNWIRVGTLCLAVLYAGITSKVSWDFWVGSFHRNMKSNSWLMTPLKWPQMALPIGLTLFTVVLILQFVQTVGKVRRGERIEESGGEAV
ncbi:MAG: TRAP transporter small permease [Candidatus Jordarchaeaceae archaeon]